MTDPPIRPLAARVQEVKEAIEAELGEFREADTASDRERVAQRVSQKIDELTELAISESSGRSHPQWVYWVVKEIAVELIRGSNLDLPLYIQPVVDSNRDRIHDFFSRNSNQGTAQLNRPLAA